MPSPGTLYRTLRHLKPEQLLHQVLFRARAKAFWQRPRAFEAGDAPGCIWPRDLELTPPAGADACLDIDCGRFRFIGLEKDFGGRIDWSGAGLGKLWDYNLHYFEWLWGLDPATAKRVVLDWMERHPYAPGAVGWEPYPLSLRIQNCLAYWGTAGRELLESDDGFRNRLWASVAGQCDWLSRRLEKHLLGNHYLENGAALWLAGRFYEGPEWGVWKECGRAILEEQLAEQVLPDGMHFERSPMYHDRLVHLLSWLSAIDVETFGARLEAVASASALLRHPDGRIALFNDSAFGIYPDPPGSPRGNTGEPAAGPFALPDAGYYGYRGPSGDYLIVDAGRIGPDYIPGHAHCDVLSFELSLGGERFITDTGVFNYERNEKRNYCRSTAAHNTFGPAGREQAEMWAAFRVGRRPDVEVIEWAGEDDGGCLLKARHDGFERACAAAARCERHFYYGPEECLVIDDVFSADAELDWEGRLHFHPGVRVLEQDGESVLLEHAGKSVGLRIEHADGFSVGTSPYHPRFNEKEERLCITYRVRTDEGMVRLALEW